MDFENPGAEAHAIQPDAGSERPNMVGAILAGLAAAAVSALVWYGIVVLTNYQIGLVAVGVGFLVGLGVTVGSGGRRGMALQVLSVAITLPAMALGEYLVVRHFVAAEQAVPWLLPPDVMLGLVVAGLRADPLTLLFWAIALWTAFKLPARGASA